MSKLQSDIRLGICVMRLKTRLRLKESTLIYFVSVTKSVPHVPTYAINKWDTEEDLLLVVSASSL